MVKIYKFGPNPTAVEEPGGVLHGFEVVGSMERDPRFDELYEALGVEWDDAEYVEMEHPDGRLALVGLFITGHPFAIKYPNK